MTIKLTKYIIYQGRKNDSRGRMRGRIFLVNKPSGPTSYRIVSYFKKIFPGEKIGHAGTLDPLAAGLLIVLVGEATKRQAEFMKLEKEYRLEMVLGVKSETDDAEGKVEFYLPPRVIYPRLVALKKEDLSRVLNRYFQGKITQRVPSFSAVKVRGKPLYRWARRGKIKEVEIPSRQVEIKKIRLTSFLPLKKREKDAERAIPFLPRAEIKMTVSSGFYVRSLARDLGERLKVGGVVIKLIRERIGPYRLSQALKPEDIRANGDR